MPVEIKVGPPQLAIHQGFTVLVTNPDGGITWPSDKGLYYCDTRLISAYAVYTNGLEWSLLNSGAPTYYGCRIYQTNQAFPSEGGDVPARSVSYVLSRVVDGGLVEQHEITNYGRSAVTFNHEIALRSDFADVFEVKAARIIRRGRITSAWSESAAGDAGELVTCYSNGIFQRGLRVRTSGDSPAVWVNGRLSFAVSLQPGATWCGTLRMDVLDGDTVIPAPNDCVVGANGDGAQATDLARWRAGTMRLTSSNHGLQALFEQAVEDMAALRLPIEQDGVTRVVPAAGLPWFVALFGRDTLITSLQSMTLGPEFALGTLDVLAAWQATERDDYRDAEPGKILHELRRGELAALKLIPHTPYYGTADATPLFVVLLHATWKATGDDALLHRHMKTVQGCLDWIDHYGDRDGDGFQEYGTRSGQGYENVGWKDAGEAVVDVDGTLIRGPKALCELQGYVYAAWRGMAEVFTHLAEPNQAAVLTAKADALYTRFNDAFWDEKAGFYAFCLDGTKRPIWTVSSNPGHLLWSGIVPPERAARVAERLLQPDMWSGWGIRTLTSDNPTYNPYSYQNGSVWPHDNSLIALGCARYRLHDATNRIAGDVSGAASFFVQRQLPELYSGVPRTETNFPVQYLGANVPQAWAAASVFAFMQAILGLRPDAPAGRLRLDPALPDWLPDVTLHGLRMGQDSFDIAFRREGDATLYTVLSGDAAAVVRDPA